MNRNDHPTNLYAILIITLGLVCIVLGTSRCASPPTSDQTVTYPSGLPSPSATTGAPLPALSGASKTIDAIVEGSACAAYKWKDRSRAPIGYLKGMAHAYARNLCRWRSPDTTVAGVIGGPIGSSSQDALAWYGLKPSDRLLATWALGIGLGMRESSGKYCEGRDMSTDNVTADTAEAGTFQASYNSRGASLDRLNGLWAWYKAHPAACDLSIWREGVNPAHKSCQPLPAGFGPGFSWQEFTRTCPAFGAEWSMTLVRKLRKHFGPLNRHEAELRLDCVKMLEQVREVVRCS